VAFIFSSFTLCLLAISRLVAFTEKCKILNCRRVTFSQESSGEEELVPRRQINRRSADVPVVLSPEEVTEADIRNVAQKSGGKTYSSEHGTCCHQCR
jgi:hypothetical protein